MKTYNVSMIIPTRNEEKIVVHNLEKINRYLKNSRIIRNYEILVSDYSTDKTPEKIKELGRKNPKIRYIDAGKKGIGAGILAGLKNSRLDYIVLYPIDLSWNFESIEKSIQTLETHDIVLASREHKNSITSRPMKRIAFSKIYNFIIKKAFGLKINDTQCNFAARRTDINKYINKLDSDSAFLQTQILIHAKKIGLSIIEIPAIVNDTRPDSKIDVLKDGTQMLKEIINEKLKCYESI